MSCIKIHFILLFVPSNMKTAQYLSPPGKNSLYAPILFLCLLDHPWQRQIPGQRVTINNWSCQAEYARNFFSNIYSFLSEKNWIKGLFSFKKIDGKEYMIKYRIVGVYLAWILLHQPFVVACVRLIIPKFYRASIQGTKCPTLAKPWYLTYLTMNI